MSDEEAVWPLYREMLDTDRYRIENVPIALTRG